MADDRYLGIIAVVIFPLVDFISWSYLTGVLATYNPQRSWPTYFQTGRLRLAILSLIIIVFLLRIVGAIDLEKTALLKIFVIVLGILYFGRFAQDLSSGKIVRDE